jgi:hypothetical protein
MKGISVHQHYYSGTRTKSLAIVQTCADVISATKEEKATVCQQFGTCLYVL